MNSVEGSVPQLEMQAAEQRPQHQFKNAVSRIALAAALLAGTSSCDYPAENTRPPQHETASPTSPEVAEKPDKAHPNVVFILADDLEMKSLKDIPSLKELLIDKGVSATNYIDANGLCCPSRATILTGKYMHNHRVESNNEPNGGYGEFKREGLEESTLATWITDIKDEKNNPIYDTMIMGKYMNSYPYQYLAHGKKGTQYVPANYVPPGWTHAVLPVEGGMYQQKHYKLNVNGVVDKNFRDMGKNPEDFMLATLQKQAEDYIIEHGEDNKPFFMHWSPPTPHFPSTHSRKYNNFPVDFSERENNPAYNEADISDKPPLMQLPTLTEDQQRQIESIHTQRTRSLQDFGDALEGMIDALKESGQYDNTYFIVTSDNGYHLGEHRLPSGKNTAYDTDVNVPFIVIGPGIKSGTTFDESVGNMDIAATIADMTGAKPDYATDGRSMLPLLKGKDVDWSNYRLIERGDSQGYSALYDSMAEPADNPAEIGITSTEPYEGVRTKRFTYVEYENGQKEFYDNKKDPNQLNNLFASKLTPFYDRVLSNLVAALVKLENCEGKDCQVE